MRSRKPDTGARNPSARSTNSGAAAATAKPLPQTSSSSLLSSSLDSGSEKAGTRPTDLTSRPIDEETYARLRALGMPAAITQEDFVRLMNRPTTTTRKQQDGPSRSAKARGERDETGESQIRSAMEYLSVHLVGRDEARRLRGCISQAREAHSRPASRIKAPSIHAMKSVDVLDDPMGTAIVRRDMAYRNLDSVRREYQVEVGRCGTLDQQRRELANELAAKRRAEMLLRVLERREQIRLQRIGLGHGSHKGIGTLVNELREESNLAMRQLRSLLLEHQNSSPSTRNVNTPSAPTTTRRNAIKYKHTTEALANLHALHVRSAEGKGRGGDAARAGIEPRGASRSGMGSESVVARLEGLLKRLGVDDEAGVEKLRTRLVAAARRRAAARDQNPSAVDKSRLSEMHAANDAKRRDVQTRIHRAVALGWVCEGYIDLISTFRSETAPALRVALEAEKTRVEGYVDAVREGILEARPKPDASFAERARDAMGSTRLGLPDEVREVLRHLAMSEKLVGVPLADARDGDWPEISVDAERNLRLLERKAPKMEYGFGIAEEVKEVLGDVRRLR